MKAWEWIGAAATISRRRRARPISPPATRAMASRIFSPASRRGHNRPLLGEGGDTMHKWLPAALDYIPRWIEFQMRQSEQPGCVIAVADRGKLVLEQAFGHADLDQGTALTPRHRFRVASHSKSFTSAGIMKLREAGHLHLDQAVAHYVGGLHRSIAEATISQLLSHTAGLVRHGWDSRQCQDRPPFLPMPALKAPLPQPPSIPT